MCNATEYNEYFTVPVPQMSVMTVAFWIRIEDPMFFDGNWRYMLDARDILPESYATSIAVGGGWAYHVNGINQGNGALNATLVEDQWIRLVFTSTGANTAGNIFFNARHTHNEYIFQAKYADVRVYDRILTPQEIQTGTYQNTGLVARYDFKDATSTTAPDLSGNDRVATLYGDPIKGGSGTEHYAPGSSWQDTENWARTGNWIYYQGDYSGGYCWYADPGVEVYATLDKPVIGNAIELDFGGDPAPTSTLFQIRPVGTSQWVDLGVKNTTHVSTLPLPNSNTYYDLRVRNNPGAPGSYTILDKTSVI
ncbi:hypothetical protein [Solirubrum puertoriconensis]|uniref:Uncharacterized protein n=1 Tax=Solirubrum puertoriconensis TaxID=1751427 RepID=A0A9X0HK53_SOLP1|nr:hypothetical protein [Solirubrum puertoriconensis]KUG07410.1 hypothetical protein ASU33_13740 [Solirubrum puertoriconensis]